MIRIKCKIWFESNQEETDQSSMIQIKCKIWFESIHSENFQKTSNSNKNFSNSNYISEISDFCLFIMISSIQFQCKHITSSPNDSNMLGQVVDQACNLKSCTHIWQEIIIMEHAIKNQNTQSQYPHHKILSLGSSTQLTKKPHL